MFVGCCAPFRDFMPSVRREEVRSIQYLRGIAALMVVVHHALDQFSGFKQLIPTDTGAAGIDIFFVISGFVMTYTTQIQKVSGGQFLVRRAARIVPLYWIVTMFTAALLFFGSAMVRHSTFNFAHLVASLFFWPMRNPGDAGTISPILKLGWTLNYEMFFYLIFASVIHLPPGKRTAL